MWPELRSRSRSEAVLFGRSLSRSRCEDVKEKTFYLQLFSLFYMKTSRSRSQSRWKKSTCSWSRSKKDRLRNTACDFSQPYLIFCDPFWPHMTSADLMEPHQTTSCDPASKETAAVLVCCSRKYRPPCNIGPTYRTVPVKNELATA